MQGARSGEYGEWRHTIFGKKLGDRHGSVVRGVIVMEKLIARLPQISFLLPQTAAQSFPNFQVESLTLWTPPLASIKINQHCFDV